MGEGYSLPSVHNQQLLDKATKLFKTSNVEQQNIIKDFLKELNKEKAGLLKQNEALQKDYSGLRADFQKQKMYNSEIEKDRHKWKCEAQRFKNFPHKDQPLKKIQKFVSLDETQTENPKQMPPRSVSLQENSDKSGGDLKLQNIKERENFESEVQKLQEDKKTLIDENEKLKHYNKILEEVKENALSRLSKIAGIQLTKGNTGITDLSDTNRPTNLAEKWSTLYTDEWSDAFDAFVEDKTTKTDDCLVEKELCSIVQKCYTICKEIEQRQIKDIKTHVWDIACCLHQRPDQLVSAARTTLYGKLQKDVDTKKKAATMNPKNDAYADEKVLAIYKCTEELNQIVHERRKYDKQLLQYVIQKTVQHFEKHIEPKYHTKVINFIKRCTELCWTMVIKDPSMVLIYDQIEGKAVDRNEFSPYTKSGPVIDFVIWPALFLNKGGPILAKGVVQCKSEGPNDTKKQKVLANESTMAEESICSSQIPDLNTETNTSVHQSVDQNKCLQESVVVQTITSRQDNIESNSTKEEEKSPIDSPRGISPPKDTFTKQ